MSYVCFIPTDGLSLGIVGPFTYWERRPSVSRAQRIVCEFFGLPPEAMTDAGRARREARPRQVAMYLSRKATKCSLPEIGRRFGGRDHTTVMHAVRQVEKLCAEDPDFAVDVNLMRERLVA